MKLILREDVSKLGNCGDVIEVRPGYARNYLIPRGIGLELSQANLDRIVVEADRRNAERQAEKESAQNLAKRIESESWSVEAKMNDEGHLFGSVSYTDIVALFVSKKFDVSEKAIRFEDEDIHPIKEKGVYSMLVDLGHEVQAKVNLFVVPGE